MAKLCILLALLFVGGFALPAPQDELDIREDMSIFFDHTMTDASGRIVGGNVAPEGAYPWMVVLTHGIMQNFRCGGSIITSRHMLTAAHCIVTIPPFDIIMSPTHRIRVGTNVWNSGGQVYRLGGFRIHEEYDWFNIQNDIGILITRDRIEMNRRVAPIPINSRFVPGNIPVRVSGFGRVKAGGPLSERLMELRKTTVEFSRCVKEVTEKAEVMEQPIPDMDNNTMLCAFNAINQAVCNGDSGSPLILDANQQVGIVSWGLPCAVGVPDVFVRVSAYIDWIVINTAL